LESIWASCLSLFALGPAERLDAYNILSLYLSTLKHVILGPDEYDLRNSNDFWDEIRRGLVRVSAPTVSASLLALYTHPAA
jgi:hypothetical protein